ncbi:hypothetical protein D3C86_1956660 [compost metagenome]
MSSMSLTRFSRALELRRIVSMVWRWAGSKGPITSSRRTLPAASRTVSGARSSWEMVLRNWRLRSFAWVTAASLSCWRRSRSTWGVASIASERTPSIWPFSLNTGERTAFQ